MSVSTDSPASGLNCKLSIPHSSDFESRRTDVKLYLNLYSRIFLEWVWKYKPASENSFYWKVPVSWKHTISVTHWCFTHTPYWRTHNCIVEPSCGVSCWLRCTWLENKCHVVFAEGDNHFLFFLLLPRLKIVKISFKCKQFFVQLRREPVSTNSACLTTNYISDH